MKRPKIMPVCVPVSFLASPCSRCGMYNQPTHCVTVEGKEVTFCKEHCPEHGGPHGTRKEH